MATLSNLQLPPPRLWQDFESLCCDLWRAQWNDPNAQRHGRHGQSQHGVDVFGNPDRQAAWSGVQCKGKDNYTNKTVTEDEFRDEIEKAKSFTPALSHFTLATTGPRDAAIQQVARTISDAHRHSGLFTVDVWSWEDIVETLEQYPEVVAKHYPEFALTASVRDGFDQINATQREALQQQAQAADDIKTHITVTASHVEQKLATIPETLLAIYHDNALDLARDYLNDNKPAQALEYLDQQRRVLWSQASPQTKARLLTGMGAANLALVEEQRAAELFLEALQYAPDDEKALCNAAIGHLLLDDYPQALARANQVIDKNPANYQARAVAVQAAQESLSHIVEELPDFCKENRDVAFALGAVARRQVDLRQAVRWYRVAAKGDDPLPDIKAILGQTLLEQLQSDPQSPFRIGQLTDDIQTQLEEIEQLLTDAWCAIPEEASRCPRLPWLINRGIIRRFLGRMGEARNDFEEALRLKPDQPVAAYFCATIADDDGDTAKALELAENIKQCDALPYLPLFVANLVLRSKGPAEAVKQLEKSLEKGVDEALESSARETLAEAYKYNGTFDKATSLCDELLQADPGNVRLLVLASQIRRKKGDGEAADALLARARRCLQPSSACQDSLILGDEFYTLKRFDDAATAYERIVQPSVDSSLTHRFLHSCYQASRLEQALDVCKSLRQRHGPLRYVAEMESVIYEEIGDLPASRNACEDYLKLTPDDDQMRVRLAVVHLRQRNNEAVDAFLANLPSWENLPVDFAVQIANLLAVRERYREATELVYRIRRKHPEGKVHLRYIHSVLFHGNEEREWLEVSEVGKDTAVYVEDAAGNRHSFILEDSDAPRVEAGEINREHRLWNELVGRKVGDTILLKESVISPEHGTVVEIKSKYIHAFHECGQILQTRYPDVKGFEAVHLPKEAGAGIKKILDQVEKHHDSQRQAIHDYQDNPFPLGALAHGMGRNILEAWSAVVHDREVKLRCCVGHPDERQCASDLLNTDPPPTLVIDPVSLMTIDALGVCNDVVRIAGRLGVAQSTIDLLSETLHKRRAINRTGFLAVRKEDDSFVKQEVSAEDVEQNLVWLENLLRWIEVSCDVFPWPLSITMTRSEREQLSGLLGEESVDTMLVAAGEGRVIYSDDQWLRGLGKGELGINGVWTQLLLWEGLDKGTLERERYDQAVISLACAGYVHTGIDGNVLLSAARKAKYRPVWPYDAVADLLRGPECDEPSAVRVAADFIHRLWNEVILPESIDYLVLRLLDSLTHQRPTRRVLERLAAAIKQRFILNPIAQRDLLRLMNAWASMRII